MIRKISELSRKSWDDAFEPESSLEGSFSNVEFEADAGMFLYLPKAIPPNLKSLAKYVWENFPTYEDAYLARYDSGHPKHHEFVTKLGKVKIGYGKTWSDFGFSGLPDFYNSVKANYESLKK